MRYSKTNCCSCPAYCGGKIGKVRGTKTLFAVSKKEAFSLRKYLISPEPKIFAKLFGIEPFLFLNNFIKTGNSISYFNKFIVHIIYCYIRSTVDRCNNVMGCFVTV